MCFILHIVMYKIQDHKIKNVKHKQYYMNCHTHASHLVQKWMVGCI
jgi:hypothetical protein